MLRRLLPLLLLAVAPLAALAAETITTTTGESYVNAEVTSRTPASITITHESGVATLPLHELPPAWQARYGYDPKAAQAWLARVALARRQALAQQQAEQQQQAQASRQQSAAAQRAESRAAIQSFMESGARLIFDPLTNQVFFSEAEARLAREQLRRGK